MTAGLIRRFQFAGSLFTLCALLPASAMAETTAVSFPSLPAELSDSFAQVDMAWTASPLAFAAAGFAEGPASGYGVYTPRSASVFASGEPMTVYLQPTGYGFEETGSGYGYKMSVSYQLLTPSGQVLAAENGFASVAGTSRSKDRQAYTSLTFKFEGLPSGNYMLETSVADAVDNKSAVVRLPFEVKAEQK